METPLVSVICLCYNQRRFVREAVESVLRQTYSNIQIIIVDDASTDGSQQVIQILRDKHQEIELVMLSENLGNCAAFNRGLVLANGEYVIDLAADDVMLPERIQKQVDQFSKLDKSYGVVFSDAEYIDANGGHIRYHYRYLFQKKLLTIIPEGDVYRYVLSQYFIASPTMMIKKSVLDFLHGYDEALVYEDFDFWVRSSRHFKYAFLNERLTRIRKIEKSMSTGWYKKGDHQLHSTYLVCCKALKLNRDGEDKKALLIRIRYELRQAVFSGNKKEAVLFYQLLRDMKSITTVDVLLHFICKINLPVGWIRNVYHTFRYH